VGAADVMICAARSAGSTGFDPMSFADGRLRENTA
jgi:hypothetical protein